MKTTTTTTKTDTATLIQKFLVTGGTIKKCPQRYSGSETDDAWYEGIYDHRLNSLWSTATH
jgi:hypothetical protein